jgi:hypothetical protein
MGAMIILRGFPIAALLVGFGATGCAQDGARAARPHIVGMTRTSTTAMLTGHGCASSMLYDRLSFTFVEGKPIKAFQTIDTFVATRSARGSAIVFDIRGHLFADKDRTVELVLDVAGRKIVEQLRADPEQPNFTRSLKANLAATDDQTTVLMTLKPPPAFRSGEQFSVGVDSIDFHLTRDDCAMSARGTGKSGG